VSAVSSTNFNERGVDPAAIPPDYADFMQKTWKLFAGMMEEMKNGGTTSAEEVAGVVFEAATDGKTKLRYYVGADSSGVVKAKHESKTDEEYLAFARSKFGPTSFEEPQKPVARKCIIV
jgi:hypothetical protein